MKKSIFAILFLVAFGSGIQSALAQDLMILQYKVDTLKVKILEIGTDEIKYKFWPVDESMPIMVESKDRVKKIILSNGTIMKFSENEFSNADNYANQKKVVIKMDLFSVIVGTTSIAYEQSIEPGRSWELGVGMIGLGAKVNGDGDRSGAFFRAGYKFINQPDYYMKGMRYTHILKGGYIRPEIVAHIYNQKESFSTGNYNGGSGSTYTITKTEEVNRYSGFGFVLNFGKQWIYSDIFCVDIFVGGGLGTGNKSLVSKSQSTIPYTNYSYYDNYSSDSPYGTGFAVNHSGKFNFVGQFGLKLGILLGGKKSDK